MSADITVAFNRLPQIGGSLEDRVVDVLNRGILSVEAATVPLIPVDTGNLRSNRTTEMATTGNPVATLSFNADYASYRHEGTARMAGVPFARMGMDQAAPDITAEFQRIVEG